ncbi:hypothetical protein HanXRQr2_Chr04g0180591 [Helianthus annuus]|uniref:Uncharacterized protein n=1 Tax=Helianthus annuus TaxID=4232 RepID=A0A9K3JAD6_HELAN|nr:hypothetical protein HanXRQr2_Chr04g0180591 [Helianthus annuus]KAJ0932472.1 hypothetical protein HanPSC8_Chr04g0174011 [Helianthus annuus]
MMIRLIKFHCQQKDAWSVEVPLVARFGLVTAIEDAYDDFVHEVSPIGDEFDMFC